MATIHTKGRFPRLLDKTLTGIMENYLKSLPNMREKMFKMQTMDTAWDSYWTIGDVPDIPELTGTLTYLSISPGFYTKIEPKEYAAGLQFSRTLLDDKQYPVLKNNAKKLVGSMNRVMEKAAVDIFNGAFSTSFTFMTSEEGVSLCNSSHKTKSGVSTSKGFDNAGTSPLSKTSLATTALLMRQFRSDIGERFDVNPNTLIIPAALEDTAREIIESKLDPETANNAVNPQYGKWKLVVWPLMDDNDSNNWFVTDFALQKEWLLWLDRIKPETKATTDFDTFTTKVSVYSRFGCGFIEWRWIYGHEVS